MWTMRPIMPAPETSLQMFLSKWIAVLSKRKGGGEEPQPRKEGDRWMWQLPRNGKIDVFRKLINTCQKEITDVLCSCSQRKKLEILKSKSNQTLFYPCVRCLRGCGIYFPLTYCAFIKTRKTFMILPTDTNLSLFYSIYNKSSENKSLHSFG